jgi:glycosyltransferase involved in cell wall biosynthesis
MSSRVSVIMATKNSQLRIDRALSSIDDQGDSILEVVVVDAGSTDGTQAILAAHPRVKLVVGEGTGFAEAWNQGIAAASGEFIAFLDSDDYWASDAVARHLEVLTHDSEIDATVGKVRFFLDQDHVPKSFRSELLEHSVVGNMPGTVMVRHRKLTDVGDFPIELGIAADIEWFARLRDSLVVEPIDSVVLHKSVHDSNLSYTHAESAIHDYNKSILQVVRNQLNRNRS